MATLTMAQVMDTAYQMQRKFDDTDLYRRPELQDVAEEYLVQYTDQVRTGDRRPFDYLDEIATRYWANRTISTAQWRGVLNCLRAESIRAHREPQDTVTPGQPQDAPRPGTYTLVCPSHRRTIRIKEVDFGDLPQGTLKIQYLTGSDNDTSFTSCAFLRPNGTLQVWGRFAADQGLIDDLRTFLALGDADRTQAGLAYALESGRCCRCGRTLTVPASIHQGMGPDCAAKAA